VLTPFTLNRTHPLEGLLMRAVSALALGICGGVCAWLFRGRVSAWEIAGVDALAFLWTALGANLRHSHVWLSYGMWERLFSSPAQHQVHHSLEARHHDTNFGEALGVWDWMFGTLYVTSAEREVKACGLAEQNHEATVISMLLAPLGLLPTEAAGTSATCAEASVDGSPGAAPPPKRCRRSLATHGGCTPTLRVPATASQPQ
jgi:sterol desaturase/sphingolipid hydroxylase (fatty acid hydroxylase superfamily)